MYDALTMWISLGRTRPSVMIPGLSPMEGRRCRQEDSGPQARARLTFHDAAPFNADAVVWNVEKVLKQDARSRRQPVGVTARACDAGSAKKIDDQPVE